MHFDVDPVTRQTSQFSKAVLLVKIQRVPIQLLRRLCLRLGPPEVHCTTDLACLLSKTKDLHLSEHDGLHAANAVGASTCHCQERGTFLPGLLDCRSSLSLPASQRFLPRLMLALNYYAEKLFEPLKVGDSVLIPGRLFRIIQQLASQESDGWRGGQLLP